MQCNIDSRGRVARLILALLILVTAALVVVFWALPAGGWLAWGTATILLLLGGFGLFEARSGWCAARAMGFKTPF